MEQRFAPELLDGLDEPVRRYLQHALAAGTRLSRGVRLEMRGRIKVGVWLGFGSVWEGDGRSLSWRANAGPGPLRLLRVHDQFAAGRGFMDIRLRTPFRPLPALKLLHAANDDVARSGACRAALEALWAPMSLLPDRGVRWRAESDDRVVASWEVPPEQPEVNIGIGPAWPGPELQRAPLARREGWLYPLRCGRACRDLVRRGDHSQSPDGGVGPRNRRLVPILQGRGDGGRASRLVACQGRDGRVAAPGRSRDRGAGWDRFSVPSGTRAT